MLNSFTVEREVGAQLLWVLRLLPDCDLHVALFLPTVAVDGSLRVDWSARSSLSDLALLGNTRTCLARRLILTAPLGALDFSEVPWTLSLSLSLSLSLNLSLVWVWWCTSADSCSVSSRTHQLLFLSALWSRIQTKQMAQSFWWKPPSWTDAHISNRLGGWTCGKLLFEKLWSFYDNQTFNGVWGILWF